MALYMIRRKSDGLYSRGGSTPAFGPNGKIWKGLGPLKLHLHGAELGSERWPRRAYVGDDYEVIEIEFVVKSAQPLEDFISNVKAVKAKNELKRKMREQQRREADEQRKLKELADKHHFSLIKNEPIG